MASFSVMRVRQEKGHVTRVKVGKAYFYEARTPREGAFRRMRRRIADAVGDALSYSGTLARVADVRRRIEFLRRKFYPSPLARRSLTMASLAGLALVAAVAGAQVVVTKPAPQASNATTEGTIHGTITTPDGHPAAGVQMILCDKIGYHYHILDDGSVAGYPITYNPQLNLKPDDIPTLTTAADGRFEFRTHSPRYYILARNQGGATVIGEKEFVNGSRIVLQPWGRLEGDAQLEDQPQAGIHICADFSPMVSYERPADPGDENYSANRKLYYENFLEFAKRDWAETDAAGHFAFAKVIPGKYRINAANGLPDTPAFGAKTSISTHINIEVRPGVTTRVALGVAGRPVIGRLVARGKGTEYLNWSLGSAMVEALDNRPPEAVMRGDPAAVAQWKQDGFLRKSLINRKYSYAKMKFELDGSFRIPYLTSGTYCLTVLLNQSIFNAGSTPANEGSGRIGSRELFFDVPAPDAQQNPAPVDLGDLLIDNPLEPQGPPIRKMQKTLTTGTQAQAAATTTTTAAPGPPAGSGPRLQFRLVAKDQNPAGAEKLPLGEAEQWSAYSSGLWIEKTVLCSEQDLTTATAGSVAVEPISFVPNTPPDSSPNTPPISLVEFQMAPEGAKRLADLTGALADRQVAMVFAGQVIRVFKAGRIDLSGRNFIITGSTPATAEGIAKAVQDVPQPLRPVTSAGTPPQPLATPDGWTSTADYLIEAQILDTDTTASRASGKQFNLFEFLHWGGRIPANTQFTSSFIAPASSILSAGHQALIQDRLAAGQLLLTSQPRLFVRDNVESTLSIGQQVPVKTGNRIAYEFVGVEMKITLGNGKYRQIIAGVQLAASQREESGAIKKQSAKISEILYDPNRSILIGNPLRANQYIHLLVRDLTARPPVANELTPAQAVELAATLTNAACRRLYHKSPFKPGDFREGWGDGHWKYWSEFPGGGSGYSAQVSFDATGQDRRVYVGQVSFSPIKF